MITISTSEIKNCIREVYDEIKHPKPAAEESSCSGTLAPGFFANSTSHFNNIISIAKKCNLEGTVNKSGLKIHFFMKGNSTDIDTFISAVNLQYK